MPAEPKIAAPKAAPRRSATLRSGAAEAVGVDSNSKISPPAPEKTEIKPEVPSEPPALPPPIAQPRAGCTLLELVMYMNNVYPAWTFFIPPKGINDIIGCKRAAVSPHVCQKWIFIQIGNEDDRRRTGEVRSSFVQNAFSNRAVPCYMTHAATIVFTDANSGSRMRL